MLRRERILRRAMQRYWRWQRGLTLGARGLVLDAENRVLLVRHTYSPGWIFPGGGVEFGESAETALRRELEEEAHIHVTGPPELFGLYSNSALYPGDHVALYRVRHWTQPSLPAPNREIAEVGFHPISALPDGTTDGTRRRIAEVLDGMTPSDRW